MYLRRRVLSCSADPSASLECTAELDRWAALQEGVKALPERYREVFGFIFYHGWKPAQVAEVLGVSERHVRRLWSKACLSLNRAIGANVPRV